MQKKSFHLIPATLLCLFFACQSNPTSNEKNLRPKEDFFSSSPQLSEKLPLPSITNEPPSAKSQDVWDTDDVDISEIDRTRKLIAFTFDDAPSKTLENILAVFADFNEKNPDCKATATVFFNGKRLDECSVHLLHVAYALGFELGNHTHSHCDLTALTEEEIIEEIDETDELLKKIDKKTRHLLRAPFGRIDERIRSVASVPIIDWSIDTLDWTGVSEEYIYEQVFNNCFSGAIALLHDGYEHTVSALKRLLPDLKAAGYQVVSVSKMAKAHRCNLRRGKVYIRARKQN